MWPKSIVIVPILCVIADAARILAVFADPSHSHQTALRPLVMELARRGHEVIVFTSSPVNDLTLKNYTQVELRFSADVTKLNFDHYTYNTYGSWDFYLEVGERYAKVVDATLSNPTLRQFISPNSTEKFDLIITECLWKDTLDALSIRFKAPLIGMVTTSLFSFHHYIFGNPMLTAYDPLLLGKFDDNMNLWQRLINTYSAISEVLFYRYIVLPMQEGVLRKHFGDNMPPVHELSSNIELLFANFHPYIYPRANVPGIIPINGYRPINRNKSLPQDLEEILNDEKKGFIYFSLGSFLKSDRMPLERRNMLLRTFAKLPYKVLWKFESGYVEGKPNNVVIRKWLPQQEVLAHPKLRLFIYQGGLQSTEEASENGVPVIGIPITVDQFYNMKKLESFGVGKMLLLNDIDEHEFRDVILEVISNVKYKKNMLKLRDLLRDLPYNPLDNAIWWTEHVIRHRGAPHLRNKSRDMPWYQVQLLDVIAIILAAIVLVVYIFVMIFRFLKRIIVKALNCAKVKSNEKKQKRS